MSELLLRVRQKQLQLMRHTCDILGHILEKTSQETAQSLRDGENGWTVLEVLGHLRDFDGFFRERAERILNEDYPTLPAYDHEALAIDCHYNADDLRASYAALRASREKTIAFFSRLTEEEWERAGLHPEKGYFTLTDAVLQVGTHEANHIEQISRILLQAN